MILIFGWTILFMHKHIESSISNAILLHALEIAFLSVRTNMIFDTILKHSDWICDLHCIGEGSLIQLQMHPEVFIDEEPQHKNTANQYHSSVKVRFNEMI